MEMKLSKINSKRILTTHAGSLPRSKSLVELYSGKTSGEEIDTLKLSSEITAATLSAVNKQAEVGIDIPSNGEQSREAFFLYVQNRMTGLVRHGLDQQVMNYQIIQSSDRFVKKF